MVERQWAAWIKAQAGRLAQAVRRVPAPPPLPANYDLAAYREFMCAETWLYSADYCLRHVQVDGAQHVHDALRHGPVMVVFLHHGSWLLMNTALRHQLGVRVTSIASRRNLDFCTPQERDFWLGVHDRNARSYDAPVVFYTGDNPRTIVRWLQQPGRVLTVALDVREPRHERPEEPFRFLGDTIHLQVGPARLAQLAGATVVPAGIEFDPVRRKHHLTFHPALDRHLNAHDLTQQALDQLAPHIQRAPAQQFYDLLNTLRVPQVPVAAAPAAGQSTAPGSTHS